MNVSAKPLEAMIDEFAEAESARIHHDFDTSSKIYNRKLRFKFDGTVDPGTEGNREVCFEGSLRPVIVDPETDRELPVRIESVVTDNDGVNIRFRLPSEQELEIHKILTELNEITDQLDSLVSEIEYQTSSLLSELRDFDRQIGNLRTITAPSPENATPEELKELRDQISAEITGYNTRFDLDSITMPAQTIDAEMDNLDEIYNNELPGIVEKLNKHLSE